MQIYEVCNKHNVLNGKHKGSANMKIFIQSFNPYIKLKRYRIACDNRFMWRSGVGLIDVYIPSLVIIDQKLQLLEKIQNFERKSFRSCEIYIVLLGIRPVFLL